MKAPVFDPEPALWEPGGVSHLASRQTPPAHRHKLPLPVALLSQEAALPRFEKELRYPLASSLNLAENGAADFHLLVGVAIRHFRFHPPSLGLFESAYRIVRHEEQRRIVTLSGYVERLDVLVHPAFEDDSPPLFGAIDERVDRGVVIRWFATRVNPSLGTLPDLREFAKKGEGFCVKEQTTVGVEGLVTRWERY